MAEIKRAFPGPETISKVQRRKATFDEIRSLLILLFSVDYWKTALPPEQGDTREETLAETKEAVENYISALGKVLEEAKCPRLYYGNPYDFLFLYCTGTDQPLETLRMAVGDEEVINSKVAEEDFLSVDDDYEEPGKAIVVTENVSEAGNDLIATRKQDNVPPESIEGDPADDLLRFIFGNE